MKGLQSWESWCPHSQGKGDGGRSQASRDSTGFAGFISPILSGEGLLGPQAGSQSFDLGTGEAPKGKSAACTGGICRPVRPAVGG